MMVEKRKAAQRHRRKDGRPAAVGGSKAADGQFGARGGAVVDSDAAAQDDHRRQGADDDGVSEDLKNAEHTLLDRLFGVGAGMGVWSRCQGRLRWRRCRGKRPSAC